MEDSGMDQNKITTANDVKNVAKSFVDKQIEKQEILPQNEEEMQIAKYSNEIDSYVGGARGTVTLTEEEYNMFKSQFSKNINNFRYYPSKWYYVECQKI